MGVSTQARGMRTARAGPMSPAEGSRLSIRIERGPLVQPRPQALGARARTESLPPSARATSSAQPHPLRRQPHPLRRREGVAAAAGLSSKVLIPAGDTWGVWACLAGESLAWDVLGELHVLCDWPSEIPRVLIRKPETHFPPHARSRWGSGDVGRAQHSDREGAHGCADEHAHRPRPQQPERHPRRSSPGAVLLGTNLALRCSCNTPHDARRPESPRSTTLLTSSSSPWPCPCSSSPPTCAASSLGPASSSWPSASAPSGPSSPRWWPSSSCR